MLEGAWPRAGRCFPFELVGCGWGWVGQITQQEGLCISKAQVRSKPVAQPGSKKLPSPFKSSVSELLQIPAPHKLEAEAGQE